MPDISDALLADLASFEAIGWDFDGTLVDHPASHRIHRAIRALPQVRHLIITMRSHELVDSMGDELGHYPDAPLLDDFDEVVCIPDEMHESYTTVLAMQTVGLIRPGGPEERAYTEWKGQQCHRLGIRLLVDDSHSLCRPGCERYGIGLWHPDRFLG